MTLFCIVFSLTATPEDKNCLQSLSSPKSINHLSCVIHIPFFIDQSALSAPNQKSLTQFIQAHPTTPTTLVKIIGHTDFLEKNDLLSLDRATTIKSFLMTQGLIPDNIYTEGVGDAHPRASNATDDGRFLNRCADIYFEYLTP